MGKVGKANTGTTIRFWPDPQYFDSAKISVPRLKHALKAKAVLCPGLIATGLAQTSARNRPARYGGPLPEPGNCEVTLTE